MGFIFYMIPALKQIDLFPSFGIYIAHNGTNKVSRPMFSGSIVNTSLEDHS